MRSARSSGCGPGSTLARLPCWPSPIARPTTSTRGRGIWPSCASRQERWATARPSGALGGPITFPTCPRRKARSPPGDWGARRPMRCAGWPSDSNLTSGRCWPGTRRRWWPTSSSCRRTRPASDWPASSTTSWTTTGPASTSANGRRTPIESASTATAPPPSSATSTRWPHRRCVRASTARSSSSGGVSTATTTVRCRAARCPTSGSGPEPWSSSIRAGHAAPEGTRAAADVLVLIDYQTLIGQLSLAGRCELGDGTPLSASEARRLACEARIIPVVMGGGSLPLDVGRSRRLATGAQRAAARAVHDTCCIDGCDTPFDYCELHHVHWWGSGGRSDLANLAPVCSKHHHLIHDHGWELHLDRRRIGTLRREPAPPDRSAASAGAKPAAAGVTPSTEAGRRPIPLDPFDSLPDDAPPPRRPSGLRPERPDRPDQNRRTTIPPDAAMAPNRC